MSMQVKATVKQVSPTTSEASARMHQSLVDRPEAKGGTNRGPMGGELLLMGLGGCFMSSLLAEVRARQLAIADLAVEVTAELDGTPSRFTQVSLLVTSSHPDRAVLQEIVAIAGQGCIAINTLQSAATLSVSLS
jgi:putative redox protein